MPDVSILCPRALPALAAVLLLAAGCQRLDHVGKAPDLSAVTASAEFAASGPARAGPPGQRVSASLFQGAGGGILAGRRAAGQGDMLTVVIEIDERAEMTNSTGRSRGSSERMAIPEFLGLPQSVDPLLPQGASLGNAVSATGAASSSGDGNTRRRERLTLRLAATVLEVLPNGHYLIRGSQEIRVNFELRELVITGIVRPGDITRRNEIAYDRIASARISYGGRGHITDMQQPRWGQQLADIVLPF
ncbi:MAG: flagellar basal body L-ring protein FlgH [Rhodobacteraceae bacterium]|nr:flagellar basal body L-ring protein FlgH [Paracoccaceae bacterium]